MKLTYIMGNHLHIRYYFLNQSTTGNVLDLCPEVTVAVVLVVHYKCIRMCLLLT